MLGCWRIYILTGKMQKNISMFEYYSPTKLSNIDISVKNKLKQHLATMHVIMKGKKYLSIFTYITTYHIGDLFPQSQCHV